MSIVTKQIREGTYYDSGIKYYKYNIYAVGERIDDSKLHCPVLDFFKEQKKQHPGGLLKLSALLEHSARFGPPKNTTKFKYLEGSDRIFEFKEFQFRLFCFWDMRDVIICTNGIVKKSQHLPDEVRSIAENWKNTYLRAKSKNLLTYEPEHRKSSPQQSAKN
jgi:Phage derived protein Gp49-like (DUF891)